MITDPAPLSLSRKLVQWGDQSDRALSSRPEGAKLASKIWAIWGIIGPTSRSGPTTDTSRPGRFPKDRFSRWARFYETITKRHPNETPGRCLSFRRGNVQVF